MKAATYARYSTEDQSHASIEDQQRECERIARRAGYEVVAQFCDAGVSGGTAGRPGYQALLAAARGAGFDAIVAEDVSRLWRNLAEQAPRLAELADLGIRVITHDLDTNVDSAELLGAVQGAMNSLYRREISRRTRRGMEGLALSGKSTGGTCFGYSGVSIDPAQAAVVRMIFERRAAGDSLAMIAKRLNELRIPGPKGGAWAVSTLFSILLNRRYTGAVVWGKMACHRSAVDSRRRRLLERPTPIVSRHDESRRIISDQLWSACHV
jgi:site-specific DNA recombinase